MLGERQCLRPPGREPSGGGSGGGRLFWLRLADGLEGSPGSVGFRPPASGIPSAPLGPKRSSSGRWKICVTSAGRRSLRSEEHTSELQSHLNFLCRLLLEKKTLS